MSDPICAYCGAAIPLPLTRAQCGALAKTSQLYCPSAADGTRSPCQRAVRRAKDAAYYTRQQEQRRASPQYQRDQQINRSLL